MKLLRTILIVDDFAADRQLFRRLLAQDTEHEYLFSEAENGTQALELCRAEEFDCVLLDYDLPDMNGTDILLSIGTKRGENPIPIVMLSSNSDLKIVVAALKLGAHDYLIKDRQLEAADLLRAVSNAIEKVQLVRERIRAEKALLENQRFTQSIIETAPTVLYTFDLKTNSPNYLTAQAAATLGYTFDEFKENQAGFLQSFMHPDDAPQAERHFQKITEAHNGEVFEFEYRMRNKAGEWRWFRSRDKVFKRDADGKAAEILGIALDITDRKQATEKLSLSEARLKLAVEVAGFAVCEIDYATNSHRLSKAAAALYGLGDEEMVVSRETVHATFHPDERDELEKIIAQSLKPDGDGWFAREHRVVHKNGDVRWLNVRKQIFFDHTQNPPRPTRAILAAQDITPRKRSEKQLRRNHETFYNLVQNAPFGVYIIDADFRLIQISKGSRKVFSGVDPLLGREFAEVLRTIWAEPFATETIERFRQTLSTGEPYHAADTSKQRGDIEDVESYDWKIERITLPDGRFGVVCYFYDLTERLQYEATLRESEEKYSSFFASVDEGFCIIEMIFDEDKNPIDYRFIECNPALERLSGLKDVIGKTMLELVPNREKFWFETYGKVALTGEPIRFENKTEPLNRWFDVYASRVGDASSRRVAVVFNNITERKLAEQELAASLTREQILRQTSEDANRAKDEFLAILSHELRSPLNAMFGWATMLQKGMVDSKTAVHAVSVIERNVRLQMTLIDDLLDVSRIITGKMLLEAADLNFVTVVESAIETARPAADAKNIKIEIDFAADVCEISGDAFRLQQIVGNLLTNAVKFTADDGCIFIRLTLAENNFVRLTVKDTGCGIDEELLPNIFDRFKQADASTKRKFGGLGLGLAIVRSLVEMHGGRVTAESAGEGKGASFNVDLPLSDTANLSAEKKTENDVLNEFDASEKPLEGIKILIVEDEPDSLELLSFVLTEKGALIESANSANSALEKISAAPPDLLISDIGMAEMNGLEFIRRVRKLKSGENSYDFPAIAITGFAGNEDRDRALEAGFQLHIQKPVDVGKLPLIVKKLVSAD